MENVFVKIVMKNMIWLKIVYIDRKQIEQDIDR